MRLSGLDCFRTEGVWLKGNLHTHTINSDGYATPQEVVNWYRDNHYDFLSITDHDVITDVKSLDSGNLLLIPGIEFGYTPKEEPNWVLDMLGINIAEIPEFLDPNGSGRVQNDPEISPQRLIDHINAVGGLAIMCHPYFMINMMEPYLKYQNYVGMEAYNYVCEELCGRGHHEAYWDAMLLRGKKLWGFATDDSHEPEFGHAWIEVKAKERSIPAILNAIRQGQFYATTGIQIFDACYEDGCVKISYDRPCDVVVLPWPKHYKIVRSYEAKFELKNGKRRFYAEIPVLPGHPYVRVELRDAQGNTAYTNPLFFEQEK